MQNRFEPKREPQKSDITNDSGLPKSVTTRDKVILAIGRDEWKHELSIRPETNVDMVKELSSFFQSLQISDLAQIEKVYKKLEDLRPILKRNGGTDQDSVDNIGYDLPYYMCAFNHTVSKFLQGANVEQVIRFVDLTISFAEKLDATELGPQLPMKGSHKTTKGLAFTFALEKLLKNTRQIAEVAPGIEERLDLFEKQPLPSQL